MKRVSVWMLTAALSLSMLAPQAAFAAEEDPAQITTVEAAEAATQPEAEEDKDQIGDLANSKEEKAPTEDAAKDRSDKAEKAPTEDAANDRSDKLAGAAEKGNGRLSVSAKEEDEKAEAEDAAGDEDLQDADAPEAAAEFDPYLQVKLLQLNEEKALILPEGMDKVKLSEPKFGNGLLFSGTVGALNSGKIQIAKEFDFDRNAVGRVSVDGLADKGITVRVHVYLDEKTDPVASFTLGTQMGKKEWANAGDHTQDVYDSHITGKHEVSLGFEVSGKEDSKKAKLLIRSVEFSESSIPVMYINIDESKGTIAAMNGSSDHSVECYGSVDIQVPSGYKSEYTGKDVKSMKDLTLEYIRGRGNSTWSADKKPYKLKFDSKQDLFGMGKNKHWVLLANRYDNSLVRNRMTYWLGDKLGLEYTPQCVPVDVVMNDSYCGSYLLCEQIRVGSSRVDIDDLEDNDESMRREDLPFISGGYLLSMSPYGDEDPANMFETQRGMSLFIESPSFEDYDNEVQRNYIRTYMQATEDAIFGKNFCDDNDKSYADYLDLDAAANYWWVQEFSENGDAYGSGSTYLYKKRDGKLFWGPLWDFDFVAWGDLDYGQDPQPTFDYTNTLWFDRMRHDPVFAQKLRDRWEVLSGLLDEITREDGLLDQYYEELLVSQTYDHEKWGSYGGWWDDEDSETGNDRSYREEIDQLRTWIQARKEWVEEEDNLDQLTPKDHTITFLVDGEETDVITVREGEELNDLPAAPQKNGYLFTGWYDEYDVPYFAGDSVFADLVLHAVYVDASKAKKAKALFFGETDVYVPFYGEWDDENYYYGVNYTVKPEDAVNQNIIWDVSDWSIADVDNFGVVHYLQTGDVKVTGQLESGATASYTLHILPEREYYDAMQDAEAVVMSPSSISLKKGAYRQLKASLEPQPCYGNRLYWFSSDPEVAQVDSCGVVTAIKPGTTTIVAMDIDMHFSQCKVTVTGKGSASAKKISAAKGKKVTIKAKALKNGKVRISWKKAKGVSGYEIYKFSDKTGKYKKVATLKGAKKTKWTSKKQKKGSKNYYQVRPYTKIGKKTYRGKWSNVKLVKIKKTTAGKTAKKAGKAAAKGKK